MASEYEKLLERAKKELPEVTKSEERFEIPKATGHIQGNKTIIDNFIDICKKIARESAHLLKYLQRELATPANIESSRLILGRKISLAIVNEKIEKYVKDFVICKECGKPDTQLRKEDRITILKCMACGAKHTIKAKI